VHRLRRHPAGIGVGHGSPTASGRATTLAFRTQVGQLEHVAQARGHLEPVPEPSQLGRALAAGARR
ncbi:hypothetical protein ACO2WH_25495, partial [Escherichia coli]